MVLARQIRYTSRRSDTYCPKIQVDMAKTKETGNTPVRKHPVMIAAGVITLFLVITVAMLYPVARNYYIAYRENSRLEAEYTAVVARNDKIQQLIDDLQTPEGIEDRAREEFGWVKQGEQAVNITGLDISDSSTSLPSVVDSNSVTIPDTWWTQFLDFIFRVKAPDTSTPVTTDVIPGL